MAKKENKKERNGKKSSLRLKEAQKI